MAEFTTTSSGGRVPSIRINCDTNLSPSEIERLQRLLETSRYHFSIERFFTAQTYDSVGGRPPIAFSVLRTTLLLKFSVTWTRTKRNAIKTVINSVDKVILDSARPNRMSKVIYDADGGVAIEIEETDTPRKQRKTWTRGDVLTAVGLTFAFVAAVAAVFVVPEFRQRFHLDKQQIQTGTKPTAPQPAQTTQNPEPLKPEPSEPRKIRRTAQKTKTQAKGNGNVTGNNISGDNNVTGNGNQTGPTAIAPSGIAISGGTVIQPTVNNFTPLNRRLSDSQKTTLKSCLAAKTGTYTVSAIANNGEAYQYAQDFSEVFSGAGWKNEQTIPVAIITIVGGMWSGVRISVHGTWDETTKTASLIDGAPEAVGLNCLRAANFPATAIPWSDMKTGSIRVDVSEHPQ